MPTPGRTYPPEFRQQLVELVWAGRTPEELSREFEPSAQTIRNWVHQAERDVGQRTDGLTTPEREELTRLSSITCLRLHRQTPAPCAEPHE
jgi:transposase